MVLKAPAPVGRFADVLFSEQLEKILDVIFVDGWPHSDLVDFVDGYRQLQIAVGGLEVEVLARLAEGLSCFAAEDHRGTVVRVDDVVTNLEVHGDPVVVLVQKGVSAWRSASNATRVNQLDCQTLPITTSGCAAFHTTGGDAPTLSPMSSTPTGVDRAGIELVVQLASPVAEPLRAEGFTAYVVGGFVRDLLVGRTNSDDVDMTTSARPGEIKRLIAPIADDVWLQGERFGTIGCRIDGTDFEITTHRAERYDESSRKPVVEFASAIETDLSRRDFTVNAMAISVPSGELVDPFGGADDLAGRLLRTPADPAASFNDDPLRILRAARFQAGYDLTAVEELVEAAANLVDRLEIVSKERIRVELDKLLTTQDPTCGLGFISAVGAWPWVLPHMHGINSDSVLSSVARAVCPDADSQRLARRALLFRTANSTQDAANELRTLRYSNAEKRRTIAVISALDLVSDNDGLPLDTGPATLRRVLQLVSLDWTAALVAFRAVNSELGEALESEWTRLSVSEDLSQLGPGLTAAEVMSVLEIDSGPMVGAANDELTRIRIEEGPLAKDKLRRLLSQWFESRTHDA